MRELRTDVNRVLEDCRSKQQIGAALEAAVRIDSSSEDLDSSLRWLEAQGDSEVDCLRDWLLVSHLQIGGEPWAELLAEQVTDLANIEISKARGSKCERCWHYGTDIGTNDKYKHICGRCVDVLGRQKY